MFPFKDNIPRQHPPFVTIALIAINAIAYLVSIRHAGGSPLSELWNGPSAALVVHYGAIPYELTHAASHCQLAGVAALHAGSGAVACSDHSLTGGSQPATWTTAFSSMLLHGGLLQLAGNMLVLAIFGPTVEGAMGSLRFALFYIVAGLVALAAQVAVDPDSSVAMIGDAGAIAAVLAAYTLLYPRARVLTVVFVVFFFTLIELPALVLAGMWFAEQALLHALGLTSSLGDGGPVYAAYIGGVAFGLAAALVLTRRRRRAASLGAA